MTTLMERIRGDWKTARLAGRTQEASVLSTLVGECQTREKQANPARLLTNEEVAAVAKKFLKGIDETLENLKGKFDMPGREERLTRAEAERILLLRYLPTMLDESALEKFVRERISEGASNVGIIMKALVERHSGAYDGRLASTVAGRCLKE